MTTIKNALLLDAGVTGAMSLLLFAASSRLDDWLGIPQDVALGAAVALLAWTGLVLVAARTPKVSTTVAVAVGNATWVLLSVGYLGFGPQSVNALGAVFVVVQAVAVAGFAALQLYVVRRTSTAASVRVQEPA